MFYVTVISPDFDISMIDGEPVWTLLREDFTDPANVLKIPAGFHVSKHDDISVLKRGRKLLARQIAFSRYQDAALFCFNSLMERPSLRIEIEEVA